MAISEDLSDSGSLPLLYPVGPPARFLFEVAYSCSLLLGKPFFVLKIDVIYLYGRVANWSGAPGISESGYIECSGYDVFPDVSVPRSRPGSRPRTDKCETRYCCNFTLPRLACKC